MRMVRIVAAFFLLGLVLGGVAEAKKPKPKVLLKIATLAPEGSTWMNLMHEMDERVREATGNEVGFKFYAGGVQGDERLVLRKMRTGQLHGGGFTGNGLGVIAPSQMSSAVTVAGAGILSHSTVTAAGHPVKVGGVLSS